MKSLKLGVVQMDTVHADPKANLLRISTYVQAAASQGAELVVLPEMATTGYFIEEVLEDVAEVIPGPTTTRLGEIAGACGIYVVCGLPEREGDKFYNSAVLMSPTGSLVGTYRKVHLWGDDSNYYTPGDDAGVFETGLGTLAVTICYDLVFPEYIRALVLRGARIILNCTDWVTPESTIDVVGWNGRVTSALASARAFENRVVVAMANRVGNENSFTSLGYSCVCSQMGAIVACVEQGAGIATASVDLDVNGAAERLLEREMRIEDYRHWEKGADDLGERDRDGRAWQ